MKTKVIQTIWIAEYYLFETICATPHFDDLIDILYDKGYLNESTCTIKKETLKELYGENWLKTLKSFSARKINNLIRWNIKLRQIDVVQIEREA